MTWAVRILTLLLVLDVLLLGWSVKRYTEERALFRLLQKRTLEAYMQALQRGGQMQDRILFNIGNRLFEEGLRARGLPALRSAANYYREALRLNPDDWPAKKNYELVQKFLRTRVASKPRRRPMQTERVRPGYMPLRPNDILLGASLWDPPFGRRVARVEYLVVFDLSLSMATEDMWADGRPRSRLAAAKGLFEQVLPELPAGARLSLAGFVGRTVNVFLVSCPVDDRDAITSALQVLDWTNVWDAGSRIDLGLRDLARQMQGSPFTLGPGDRILPTPLNIVFFTDGGPDDLPTTLGEDLTAWLHRTARVTFVGVGQTTPSDVPEFKPTPPRDCFRDEAGSCVRSRLNESNLRELAERLGGRYLRLRALEDLRRVFSDPVPAGFTERPFRLGPFFALGSLSAFLAWVVFSGALPDPSRIFAFIRSRKLEKSPTAGRLKSVSSGIRRTSGEARPGSLPLSDSRRSSGVER